MNPYELEARALTLPIAMDRANALDVTADRFEELGDFAAAEVRRSWADQIRNCWPVHERGVVRNKDPHYTPIAFRNAYFTYFEDEVIHRCVNDAREGKTVLLMTVHRTESRRLDELARVVCGQWPPRRRVRFSQQQGMLSDRRVDPPMEVWRRIFVETNESLAKSKRPIKSDVTYRTQDYCKREGLLFTVKPEESPPMV